MKDFDYNKVFKESFEKAQEDLISHANLTNEFDVALSGCTISLCLFEMTRRKLY